MHAVDHGIVRAQQVAFELEIVGRIGEDEIDAGYGKLAQLFQAVPYEHATDGKTSRRATTLNHGTLLSISN
jgi:hypothetical protein